MPRSRRTLLPRLIRRAVPVDVLLHGVDVRVIQHGGHRGHVDAQLTGQSRHRVSEDMRPDLDPCDAGLAGEPENEV